MLSPAGGVPIEPCRLLLDAAPQLSQPVTHDDRRSRRPSKRSSSLSLVATRV